MVIITVVSVCFIVTSPVAALPRSKIRAATQTAGIAEAIRNGDIPVPETPSDAGAVGVNWDERARAAEQFAARRGKHMRFSSPDGGGSLTWDTPPPFESTVSEIDNVDNQFTNDRPHNELFFWPSECPTAERECCLTYNGEACGGSIRGKCTNITENDDVCMRQPIGQFWITSYFDSVCVCNGNYWGASCEQCKTGWQGDTCEERADLIVRRDFASLSDVDKQYVIDAFRLAKVTPHPFQPNVSLFDFWAVVHHWSLPDGINTFGRDALDMVQEGHAGNGAITWHRGLMAGIEYALQVATGNDSFAMPYWNWTHSMGNDNDPVLLWFGGDGSTEQSGDGVNSFCRETAGSWNWMSECDCEVNRGPFANWPIVGDWGYPMNQSIERAFGCQSPWAPSLVSQATADCVVTTTTYCADDSVDYGQNMFQKLMGGGSLCDLASTWPDGLKSADMHARTHRWLGGTIIGHHPASDPLFWMLHSFADLVFEQWVRNTMAVGEWSLVNNSWSDDSGPPGHTRLECQGPMYPLQQQIWWFADSRDRGFTYDFFNDSLNSTERPYWSEVAYEFSNPTMADLGEYTEPDSEYLTSLNTKFFLPSSCTSGSCCPSYLDEECGGSTRGTCTDVTSDDSVCDMTYHSSSLWWFTDSFSKVCVCNENYAGVDCSSCAAGYSGSDCSETSSAKERRDFAALTDTERDYVIDAFRMAMVAQSAYQPGVTVHEYFASLVFWFQTGNSVASADETEPPMTYSMDGQLLWQREILIRYEAELARITGNSSFALPYWNWAESYVNDNDVFIRFIGGDGPSHDDDEDNEYCHTALADGYGGCNCSVSREPFTGGIDLTGNFGMQVHGAVQRSFNCLGRVAAALPDKALVEYALTLETYFSVDGDECFSRTMTGHEFSSGLKAWPAGEFGGMMARVQNWIGGTMTTPALQSYRLQASPGSDPMYYFAWAFADLTLERWIQRADYNGWETTTSLPIEGADIGMNRDECLPALFPLRRNSDLLVSSSELGYTYDFFTTNPDDAIL